MSQVRVSQCHAPSRGFSPVSFLPLPVFGGPGIPRAHTVSMCLKWLVKFYAGDFSLDDAPYSSRPVEVDCDQIETLTENNQHYTRQAIDDKLEISNLSDGNHCINLVNHFDVWACRPPLPGLGFQSVPFTGETDFLLPRRQTRDGTLTLTLELCPLT